MKSGGFRSWWLVTLGWMLASWPAGALAQRGRAPALTIIDAPGPVAPSSDAYQALLDRLGEMGQRLDRVTMQNEDLARANQTLAEQVRDLRQITNSDRQGGITLYIAGTASSGVPGAGDESTAGSGSKHSESTVTRRVAGGEYDSTRGSC